MNCSTWRRGVAVTVTVGVVVAVAMLCGAVGVSQTPGSAHATTPMAQQAEEHAPDHGHVTTGGLAVHHDTVVGHLVRDTGVRRGIVVAWPALVEPHGLPAAVVAAHSARAPPRQWCPPWGRQLLLTVCIDRC